MDTISPTLRVKLWIDIQGVNAFGMGSFALLQGVAQTGSLAGAARQLGMSYRTAWGRVRTMESRLGRPVLEKRGGNKRGYRLSAFGQRCLDLFREVHQAADNAAQHVFASRMADLLAAE